MWVACKLHDISYFYKFTITEAKSLLNMLSDAVVPLVFDHHPAFVSSSYRAQKMQVQDVSLSSQADFNIHK